MKQKSFKHKVGWLLTSSSLGLVLSSGLHAEQVMPTGQQVAAVMATPVVKSKQTKLTPEEALRRGKQILASARGARDHVIAYEYIEYAANRGLPEAQFHCAIMQLDDQFVPGTDESAKKLLKRAGEQGHQQAQVALKYIIEAGDGGFEC